MLAVCFYFAPPLSSILFVSFNSLELKNSVFKSSKRKKKRLIRKVDFQTRINHRLSKRSKFEKNKENILRLVAFHLVFFGAAEAVCKDLICVFLGLKNKHICLAFKKAPDNLSVFFRGAQIILILIGIWTPVFAAHANDIDIADFSVSTWKIRLSINLSSCKYFSIRKSNTAPISVWTNIAPDEWDSNWIVEVRRNNIRTRKGVSDKGAETLREIDLQWS